MTKKLDTTPTPILVKFPAWIVELLNAESDRLAIPRIAVIIQLVDEALAARKENR